MNKIKYNLDTMLDVLRDDQARGVLMGNKYLSTLANTSGWAEKSIELLLKLGMTEEEETPEQRASEDNVEEYYARREIETKDESRSPTGYNSSGEMVELDFN